MTILERDKLPIVDQPTPGLEVLPQSPDDMLKFRREFVIKMGWFDEPYPSDMDRYDDISSTLHFVNRDDTGEILSGMRLTRINTLDESLSIDMLGSHPEMQEAAKAFGKSLDFQQTDVWDLTRLVHHLKRDQRHIESVLSILPVFGAGLAMTQPDDNKDLAWLFTTTASMKGHLDSVGIRADVIAQGRIGEKDEEESYFCIIHPIEAMQFLRKNPDGYRSIYELVNEGYQSIK